GGRPGAGGAAEERQDRAAFHTAPPPPRRRGAPSRRLPAGNRRVFYAGTYTHRSMTKRTRIEYTTTHTMSEAQPRLSSIACSLMAGSPFGPIQPAPARVGRALGETLNVLNPRVGRPSVPPTQPSVAHGEFGHVAG